jgi:molybdate transport system permease protein
MRKDDVGTDKAFRLATLSVSFLFVLLSVVALISVLSWTSPSSLLYAVTSQRIAFALWLTLSTSVVSTLLAMAVAIPAAYGLSRYNPLGSRVIEAIFSIPLILPPVALGAVLLIFFSSTPLGQVLNAIFGIVFEVPGLIVAQFCVIVPIATRTIKAAFDSVDPMYEGLAMTLGCTMWQSARRVLLPLSSNGIVAAAVLSWSRAVGEFGASVMLAGATPMKTETLPISVFLRLSVADISGMIALVLIMVAMALLVFLVLYRFGGRAILGV